MKILIADDEVVSRFMLEEMLVSWGHDVVVTNDGEAACQALQGDNAPKLAILDWKMPSMEGVDVCRKIREAPASQPPYFILLTARDTCASVIAGLNAGANDYITKPFNPDELQARLNVGIRIVELQKSLAERVQELELALAHVKQLQGILPICCYCRKVRSDQNYWQQVEGYLMAHSNLKFSHGICPECLPKAMDWTETELDLPGEPRSR
jgi:sigma-B regulation protein RsbU (phosphoserine phosphatase)